MIKTGAVTFETPYSNKGDRIFFRDKEIGRLLGRLADPDVAKQVLYVLNKAYQQGFQEGATK
jgi:hypothetical protein